MEKIFNKTLSQKLITVLLIGFAAASLCFFSICRIGEPLLHNYFNESDFAKKAEASYLRDFRAYIREHQVSATDTQKLEIWIRKKHIRHFSVSRNQILLYDSTHSGLFSGGRDHSGMLYQGGQYFHTVKFRDGYADIYLYTNYTAPYFIAFYASALLLCIIIWISILLLGIRREVRYIGELSCNVLQIGNGNMDVNMPKHRKDELGRLAQGLEQMRIALIEKEETEKEIRAAQDKLVLSMAHDLRTPLTGLMTFLEIAKKQPSSKECHIYVDRAYVKALQIRELSDQLFDLFRINSKPPMKLESPEDISYALGEYLSELYSLLEAEGFSVNAEALIWEHVHVQICIDYIGRIIDNLLSNIKKYADPDVPIKISSDFNESFAGFTLTNKCAKSNQYVQGTGIGIKNIIAMMEQMGGQCLVHPASDTYSITLLFPIISEAMK